MKSCGLVGRRGWIVTLHSQWRSNCLSEWSGV